MSNKQVLGLVGIGSPSGLLSTLPQQVQSDRTLLVFATPKVERCATEVLGCRSSMCAETWKQQHPNVFKNDNDYPTGVIVPKQEMMQLNKRLQRSDSLRKYDILITPKTTRGR